MASGSVDRSFRRRLAAYLAEGVRLASVIGRDDETWAIVIAAVVCTAIHACR